MKYKRFSWTERWSDSKETFKRKINDAVTCRFQETTFLGRWMLSAIPQAIWKYNAIFFTLLSWKYIKYIYNKNVIQLVLYLFFVLFIRVLKLNKWVKFVKEQVDIMIHRFHKSLYIRCLTYDGLIFQKFHCLVAFLCQESISILYFARKMIIINFGYQKNNNVIYLNKWIRNEYNSR